MDESATGKWDLASTYCNQGRWKDAEELDVHVMETKKQVLGPEHPSTHTSMANLAYTLKSLQDIQAVIALLEKCVEFRYKVLGPDHADFVSSSEALRTWEAEMKGSSTKHTPEDSSFLLDHSQVPNLTPSDEIAVTGTRRRAFMNLFRKR